MGWVLGETLVCDGGHFTNSASVTIFFHKSHPISRTNIYIYMCYRETSTYNVASRQRKTHDVASENTWLVLSSVTVWSTSSFLPSTAHEETLKKIKKRQHSTVYVQTRKKNGKTNSTRERHMYKAHKKNKPKTKEYNNENHRNETEHSKKRKHAKTQTKKTRKHAKTHKKNASKTNEKTNQINSPPRRRCAR